MPKPKAKKAKPEDDEKLKLHFTMAERIAFMFEKAKFAEYVDMMQRPMRFAWLNFWGGVWRGVGMALGGTVVTVIVIYLSVKGLKFAFEHAGGVPWIGEQAKEAVGWLLGVVESYKGGGGK